jgi:hypothetical protein
MASLCRTSETIKNMNITDRIRACAQLGQKLITDLPQLIGYKSQE